MKTKYKIYIALFLLAVAGSKGVGAFLVTTALIFTYAIVSFIRQILREICSTLDF